MQPAWELVSDHWAGLGRAGRFLSFHEAARSASAATVGRLQACGRKAGDCVRHGPHKELSAQGIARTRVVLPGRLACCQSEAARHREQRLLLAARVDVALEAP